VCSRARPVDHNAYMCLAALNATRNACQHHQQHEQGDTSRQPLRDPSQQPHCAATQRNRPNKQAGTWAVCHNQHSPLPRLDSANTSREAPC